MYPQEYIQFLTHFHGDRDYFECHEVLEELWKKTDSGNKDSSWVGLILLAVSTYHHRRGNFKGAKRTVEKALKIFETPANLGLDIPRLNSLLKERLALIETETAYTSFELPICDPVLLGVCKKSCARAGLVWGQESDITNLSLIHRHKLRDRTDVIRERDQSLKMRKGSE
ncbi:DUF309 domain-containing protein [Neobacillus vireti]|uniref:DUF309 domain-containing protein n=1 Tax=Neobacillus vireti LMG 21834 TaxID=1131730 RepID=A0AB94ITI0_9BACI|nr:DUF309 domain-containing protein [Neobacillus vireti]ETI70374.1 hypothetical protein BAVI_02719 [Neobacillus vireti LMG 21834]KLT17116.1 hypothetical protein AA980_14595 [Neobacillus vireti]